MNEFGILFRAEMVRALLAGRKTETRRRVTKPSTPYTYGRRLWVRECWQYWDWSGDGDPWVRYRADNSTRFVVSQRDLWEPFAALSEKENFARHGAARDNRWRPAIHMFREFSRIDLRVTLAPYKERLEDIDDRAANREGFDSRGDFLTYCRRINKMAPTENPLVWVIRFEVVQILPSAQVAA